MSRFTSETTASARHLLLWWPEWSTVLRLPRYRDAFGTAAIIGFRVVSDRLGHSTIAITLDTYSHAVPALEEEAAERFAEAVFSESAG